MSAMVVDVASSSSIYSCLEAVLNEGLVDVATVKECGTPYGARVVERRPDGGAVTLWILQAPSIDILAKIEDDVRKTRADIESDLSESAALDNVESQGSFGGRRRPTKHFRCDRCSFVSRRSNHLERHKKHHAAVAKVIACPEKGCDFKCIRDATLARHSINHLEESFDCARDGCSFRTGSCQLLAKHVRYKHEVVKAEPEKEKLECPDCAYSTTSRHFFARHRRSHEGDGLRKCGSDGAASKRTPSQCTLCAYSTTKWANLTRHVATVHGNDRQFLCNFCGTGFKRKDTLKQHMDTHKVKMDKDA